MRRSLSLSLVLAIGTPLCNEAWAQADSAQQVQDTTRQSVFEELAQDPYEARYGRPPGEGWIPLPETRTEVRFPGFVQMNYIYDAQDAGFRYGSFIPALISVPTDETGKTTFDPRTSRFSFETRTNTRDAGAVRTHFGMDLYGNLDGSAIGFRVRQAYVTWVGPKTKIAVTAGRAFSTYVDLAAWPAIADLEGPNANVGLRQGLLRVSRAFGDEQDLVLEASLEQPETSADGGEGLADLPDFAARVSWRPGWGHLTVMGLARKLVAENPAGVGRASAFGNGLALSGSWFVPGTERDTAIDNLGLRQDLVQFQVQGGSGTGRYVSDLGWTPGSDAVYDSAAEELLPLSQWGAWVAYSHWWADRWRTQLVYSFEHLSNKSIQADDFYHEGTYFLANLAWRAFTRMDAALEYLYGRHRTKDGSSGHASRVMLVLNYGF